MAEQTGGEQTPAPKTAATAPGSPSPEAAFDEMFNAFNEGSQPVTEAPADAGAAEDADTGTVHSQTEDHSPPEPDQEPAEESTDAKEEAGEGEAEAVAEAKKPDPFEKRIGREVAKRKAAEEREAAVRAELEALKAGKPAETAKAEPEAAPEPGAEAPEVAEATKALKAHEANLQLARQLKRQLRQDPEAVVQRLKSEGYQLRDWSEEAVGDWLEDVTGVAQVEAGKAAARLELGRERAKARMEQERTTFTELAHERFPWLNDPTSEGAKLVAAAMKTQPDLKRNPHGLFQAAASIAELMRVKADRAGKAAKASPAPAAPPKLPTAAGPAPVKAAAPKARPVFDELVKVAAANDPDKVNAVLDRYFTT